MNNRPANHDSDDDEDGWVCPSCYQYVSQCDCGQPKDLWPLADLATVCVCVLAAVWFGWAVHHEWPVILRRFW